MTETYISRQEAAALLDVSLAAVDRLIATGLLPRYRIRERYIRVRQRDVETLLDVPREWLLRC
jgi:excisionase family DNA binding protein